MRNGNTRRSHVNQLLREVPLCLPDTVKKKTAITQMDSKASVSSVG